MYLRPLTRKTWGSCISGLLSPELDEGDGKEDDADSDDEDKGELAGGEEDLDGGGTGCSVGWVCHVLSPTSSRIVNRTRSTATLDQSK